MSLSYAQFATAVLRSLGAPVTQNNINKLTAVGMQEGKHGNFNLMNWVLDAPGATNYNKVGVKNYPDLATGARMTAQGLSQKNTAAMKASLMANSPYGDWINAVSNFYGSWGGGRISISEQNAMAGSNRLLEGGTTANGATTYSPAGQANAIDNAINWALTQQGKPYKFGGTSDGSGWDCSTLTAAFLGKMGIQVPSLTWSQAKMGTHVDANNLKPGDLIFFHGAQGDLGHVALYLGGGLELQAPHTGAVVSVTPVNFGAIQEARRFTSDAVSNAAQSGGSYRSGVSDTGPNVTTDTTALGDTNSNANAALANATDDEVKAWIRGHYGTMAGFLDDPEIGPILMESARQGWSTQQLTGQLENTNWWKLRNDSEHAWAEKQINNPGQAGTERQQRVTDIISIAGQMGVTMTAAQVQALSEESLNSGWTTDQLKNQIIGNINWAGTGTAGQLQSTAQAMKALGRQYFMPIDDAQAHAWSIAINQGNLTEDGVKATLQTQAEQRWNFLGGIAPGDYWAPVAGAIADELEVPSSQINMADSKWASALERTNTDGTLRPATIAEARVVARNDPSWIKTDKAMSQSTTTAGDLLKSLTGTGLS